MQATFITKAIADEQMRDRVNGARVHGPRAGSSARARARRDEDVVIRLARPSDRHALRALEELDGAGRTQPLWDASVDGPVLVAEAGGTVAAALRVDGDRVVADPFRPSADLAALLRTRAEQIAAATGVPRSRRRPILARLHLHA